MNNQIWDFIKWGGKYDQMFKGKENPLYNNRFPTFKLAISLFLQRSLKNIVETGCMRQKEDWGAGCSSLIFSETLAHFPEKGHLASIDINRDNLKICYNETKHTEKIIPVNEDSVSFLNRFGDEIGLLYLDSYDIEPSDPYNKQCQAHQLKEIQAIYSRLKDDTIILLDDNFFNNGGKTELTKQFLMEKGWACPLDHEQTVWIKNV